MKRIALFLTALVTLLGGVINVKAATTGSVVTADGKTVNYSYEFTESGSNVTFSITITSIKDGDNDATIDGLVNPAFFDGNNHLLANRTGTFAVGTASTYTWENLPADTVLQIRANYAYANGGEFDITPDTYTVGGGSTPSSPTNLALNGTTKATSGEASLAVDGSTDGNSRWESVHGVDPQYWQVDLGSSQTFNTIKIVWEAAYGKTFTIEAGDNVDGEGWLTGGTTIASVTGQTFPNTQTIYVDNTTARYIKFNGIERGTGYGYSFWEFEVYNDENAPVLVEATLSDYDFTSATLSLKATDAEVANINYIITLTEVGTENTTTIRTTGANGAAISYDIDGLKPATAYSATIVANDGPNNSASATVTFTTTAIPPATTPTAQNVMSIYSDAYATNYLKGIEVNNGGTVQNYNVAEGDEVKQVTGATTITIRHNEHDADPETYNAAYIAIYPTGSTTEVTLTPTFYQSEANTVSQTYSVIPGQWNYLSFRPADFRPENYSGKDLFKLVVSQQAANTLFFDNFYYTSPNDLTAPVYASHTQSAAASYVVFNLNYTDNTDKGTLTFKIYNKGGGYEGDVTGEEGTDVRFRINNLDPETTYNYTLRVSDEAGNTSAERQLTVTTPTVTGELRVNDNPADPDAAKLTAAGMVYITGVWNTEKFIAIDQEYCATAYDLTEVDFRATDGARLDRDHDYFTFNPNAILVSPKLNKFNINYVMYDRDGETLYGYNFDMIDGDFPAATFYSGNPLYSDVIAPGIANGKYTRGMDASKYLKLDPFTGFKKIVTGQNFAFSRNLNNGDGKDNDVFATVILPFAVDVDNSGVQGSDAPLTLYKLSSAVADEGNNITLKFEEVTGVGETNKPYLVKSNIDNGGGTIYFIDSNVPKTLTFPEGNLEDMKHVGASTKDNATLFGTYVTHEATKNNTPWEGYSGWYHTGIYGLAGGNTSLTLQEMAATDNSGSIIPAWRSMVQLSDVAPNAKISLVFIDHEDEPSDPENPETPEVNPGEGETTAITRPATDSEINAVIGNVYSIDGRKVSSRGNSFMQLPAGIYIVNGKKVIVK